MYPDVTGIVTSNDVVVVSGIPVVVEATATETKQLLLLRHSVCYL